MCTLHAMVVLFVGYCQSLANRSMRIQDLYVDRFQFQGLLKNNPIRFSGEEGGNECIMNLDWKFARN
jgi:hypothetical protein